MDAYYSRNVASSLGRKFIAVVLSFQGLNREIMVPTVFRTTPPK